MFNALSKSDFILHRDILSVVMWATQVGLIVKEDMADPILFFLSQKKLLLGLRILSAFSCLQ